MVPILSNDSRGEGRPRRAAAVAVLLSLLGLAGCNQAPAKMPPPKPPVVMIAEPVIREVTDYEEGLVGQTAAVQMVEVRARVTGYLEKVNFKDGDEVKEGAVLFEIDPRPYEAEVARTEAAVGQSEAHYKRLEADLKRAREPGRPPGHRPRGIRQDRRRLRRGRRVGGDRQGEPRPRQAQPGVRQGDRADLGRLSRRMVDPGNLVKADETILTSIVSLDPMYVYFDVDERTLLRIRRLIAEGKIKSRTQAEIPIFAALADEEGFPHKGIIDFSENRVDPNTGTLRVRGRDRQPHAAGLLPGPVHARPPAGRHPAQVAPRRRAGPGDRPGAEVPLRRQARQGQGRQGRAERGRIPPGEASAPCTTGCGWSTEGLEPGEKVIVSGLQRVRPGIAGRPQADDDAGPGLAPRAGRRRGGEARRPPRPRRADKPAVPPVESHPGADPALDPRSRRPASRPRESRPVFSRFFIDRPIFAAVLSIVITLAGGIAVFTLPVAQYPADHAADGVRSTATIPAPAPRSWPRPSPRRSSSRSTASRTCSTCPRSAPTTASTT